MKIKRYFIILFITVFSLVGCYEDTDVQIVKIADTVTTTQNSATIWVNCNIASSSIGMRVYYSTTSDVYNPRVQELACVSSGSYKTTISGLSRNKTYYYQIEAFTYKTTKKFATESFKTKN